MMLTADGYMLRWKDFDKFMLVYLYNIPISKTDLEDTNSVVRKAL